MQGNRVYLVAYACEPNQGGEHEVGWQTANYLVDKCDLVVVTRTSNRKLIERYNKKNIKFIFIENNLFLRFKPKGKFSYLYYLFWQFSIFLAMRRFCGRGGLIIGPTIITFGKLYHLNYIFLFLTGIPNWVIWDPNWGGKGSWYLTFIGFYLGGFITFKGLN